MSNPINYITEPDNNDFEFSRPCVISAGYLKDEPQWSSRLHSHKHMEIVLITAGKGTIEIEEEKHEIKKNDLILIRPETTHREYSDHLEPMELYFMGVSNFLFPPFRQNTILNDEDTPIFDLTGYDQIFTRMEKLFIQLANETMFTEAFYKTISASLAECILMLIMRFYHYSKELVNVNNNYSLKIKEYLDDNYMRGINLEYLSKALFLSKHYISHVFKSEIGKSPIDYLIQKRIDVAKTFLKHTDQPVSAISQKVGYDDPVYFSQIFKKNAGVSPSFFRKKAKADFIGETHGPSTLNK